jgi:hypothetical protein
LDTAGDSVTKRSLAARFAFVQKKRQGSFTIHEQYPGSQIPALKNQGERFSPFTVCFLPSAQRHEFTQLALAYDSEDLASNGGEIHPKEKPFLLSKSFQVLVTLLRSGIFP